MQRVTLIDNYDSFTFNLVHYLGELGADVSVWRNDEITVADALADKPDAIVLSPGPCTPNEAGVCLDLVRAASETTPMLGVCLGHQAIGQAFGGDVVRAPAPMHGKVSRISHNARGLFRGLNGPFRRRAITRSLSSDQARPPSSRSARKATTGSSWAFSTSTARLSGCSSTQRASPASTAGKSCAISWISPTPFISASKPSDGNAKRGHGILQASDRQSRRRGDAHAQRGGKRVRFDAVGRSDAFANGRIPHGAEGARRDGRGDHRRRRSHAGEDAHASKRRRRRSTSSAPAATVRARSMSRPWPRSSPPPAA